MTKIDLAQKINKDLGYTKKYSLELVDRVFEILKDALANGEKVKISGFGNFQVKQKNTRRGRNPQTGDEIYIEARKVLTFKSSQLLRKAINS